MGWPRISGNVFGSKAMGTLNLRFPVGGGLAWVFFLRVISTEVGDLR